MSKKAAKTSRQHIIIPAYILLINLMRCCIHSCYLIKFHLVIMLKIIFVNIISNSLLKSKGKCNAVREHVCTYLVPVSL